MVNELEGMDPTAYILRVSYDLLYYGYRMISVCSLCPQYGKAAAALASKAKPTPFSLAKAVSDVVDIHGESAPSPLT